MMDKKDTIETTPDLQRQVKILFKRFAFDDVYDTWVDTFEIEAEGDHTAVVYYHGTEDIKTFKKKCQGPIHAAIYTAMGESIKVKITKNRGSRTLSPNAQKNIKALKFFALGMIFVCFAAAMIVIMCNYIGNRQFRETFYSTSSIKVDTNVRVIQLSDLHSVSYGNNNEALLERIKALEPDVIICTGDMVNSVTDDSDSVAAFAKSLADIAPAYYIYGNNEVETVYDFLLTEQALDEKFGFSSDNRDETALLNTEDTFEDMLEGTGMKVLKNEMDTITVKDTTIDVYGVLTSNPSSFWSYSEKAFHNYIYENTDHLKITAVHEPTIFEEFEPEYWGDLLLSGHTHGGVMRIPMLGPLYTHEGGLFPERSGSFVYGRYNAAGKPLIVSSGLENLNIFRINNQPELVVIDINKF